MIHYYEIYEVENIKRYEARRFYARIMMKDHSRQRSKELSACERKA